MRLATSTNLICDRPDGTVMPLEDMLRLAHEAGFDRFDMNFYDWALPHSPFLTDRWEAWIHSVADTAAKLGVEFGQSHAYTFDFLNPAWTDEEYEYHQTLVKRSIYCCYLLGSTICVTHPSTDYTTVSPVRTSKEKNTEYFKTLLDFALQYDMSLAIENMCDYSILPRRKYFVTPEEIIDFVDDFNDKRLGVCWDFEHADIMKMDQVQALLAIDHRLLATHVSDTHSATDPDLMHILPLFGTVSWEEVMKTLKQIGYAYDFSFEAHNYANRLPDEVLPTAIKLSYEIGRYLIGLAK